MTAQSQFVHLSDAHIGHRQYNVKKWQDDMQLSFPSAAADAVEQDVDFLSVMVDEREVELYGDEMLADGGSQTQYYWSGDEGVVYHSESGDGLVDSFFGSVDEAEQCLESLADLHSEKQYTGLALPIKYAIKSMKSQT
jgi:hypothetical protein